MSSSMKMVGGGVMSMSWFRMYNSFLHEPNVQRLPPPAFKIYVNCLCIASANDPRGTLPSLPDLAFLLRISEKKAERFRNFLKISELFVENNDGFYIYGWEKRHEVRRESLRPSPEVWKVIRRSIFERDDYTCAYCGDRGVRLECDHVIPVSRGGGHDPSNLVTACFTCNRSKCDKLVEEWM